MDQRFPRARRRRHIIEARVQAPVASHSSRFENPQISNKKDWKEPIQCWTELEAEAFVKNSLDGSALVIEHRRGIQSHLRTHTPRLQNSRTP